MNAQPAKKNEFSLNPRMTALWRMLMDIERTWKGFSPLPDLNKTLFGVMMCIAHAGKQGPEPPDAQPKKPVAVGAIAAQMHQSLPGISQKISALEELGYVSRVPDLADRRVTCVVLTETGAQKLRAGRAQFEAKLNAAMSAMGDVRMQQLVELLGELNEALKETVIVPPVKDNNKPKGE